MQIKRTVLVLGSRAQPQQVPYWVGKSDNTRWREKKTEMSQLMATQTLVVLFLQDFVCLSLTMIIRDTMQRDQQIKV